VEFRVLGPLELISGEQPLAVGGTRTRAVLAMLLVSANRVVPADRVADELWPGHPAGRGAANLQVRLSELQLACGRHHELLAELEALTAEHPLRERFWAQRLLALYRSGRQADALRAYRKLRTTLVDQLGIEPGRELRDLEGQILRQEHDLDYRAPRPAAASGWAQPETHYADSDGTHIAYQVLGDGPTL